MVTQTVVRRRWSIRAFAISGLLICAITTATGQPQSAQVPPPPSPFAHLARTPKNAAEFDALFNQVKNWGRWGKDDERGTYNLITDAKRKQASAIVKSGISVSLAHDPLTEKADDNPQPLVHTMNRGFTSETFGITFHGYSYSHLDALCHFLYKDQTYNGFARADVNTERGCTRLSIHTLKNGIVTRGILIDIARLKGVPYLEPGTPVFVEDIEAWLKKTNLKVMPGDAIFLRTGRWARRTKLGPWTTAQSIAGYHASVVPWIKARDVAIVGSDGVQDVVPSLVEGINLPVHTALIAGLGVNLFDNMDLELLSEMAAKLNRWEFMLTGAPVSVPGGTGFPVNATATF